MKNDSRIVILYNTLIHGCSNASFKLILSSGFFISNLDTKSRASSDI